VIYPSSVTYYPPLATYHPIKCRPLDHKNGRPTMIGSMLKFLFSEKLHQSLLLLATSCHDLVHSVHCHLRIGRFNHIIGWRYHQGVESPCGVEAMAATLAAPHLDLWQMNRREAVGCGKAAEPTQRSKREENVELAPEPHTRAISWTSKGRR
jgi:hypothetical protein